MPPTSVKPKDPKRGELWMVELDPARGSELNKSRPVIVLSSDMIRSLQVRVVVPVTGWQQQFSLIPWKIKLEPDAMSGLTKPSAADCLQVRCVSVERLKQRLGVLPSTLMDQIVLGVSYCLEA